jgi:protein-tyrosine-phosphatase
MLLPEVTNWAIEDPKGKPLQKIREIRDVIEERVKTLVNETI